MNGLGSGCALCGGGLTRLAADVLIRVSDTFSFVGLWGTKSTEVCGNLTNELLIDTFDREEVLVLLILNHLNTSGKLEIDGVGESEAEVEDLALRNGLVTDSDDLKLSLMTAFNALDHVHEESASETVTSLRFSVIENALHTECGAFDLNSNLREERVGELTLRSLDAHNGALHLDGDSLRDGDGFSSNARHG